MKWHGYESDVSTIPFSLPLLMPLVPTSLKHYMISHGSLTHRLANPVQFVHILNDSLCSSILSILATRKGLLSCWGWMTWMVWSEDRGRDFREIVSTSHGNSMYNDDMVIIWHDPLWYISWQYCRSGFCVGHCHPYTIPYYSIPSHPIPYGVLMGCACLACACVVPMMVSAHWPISNPNTSQWFKW